MYQVCRPGGEVECTKCVDWGGGGVECTKCVDWGGGRVYQVCRLGGGGVECTIPWDVGGWPGCIFLYINLQSGNIKLECV